MGESEVKKKGKPVKLEKVAEETGELIGKGLRKTWGVAKSCGKGLWIHLRIEKSGKTPRL